MKKLSILLFILIGLSFQQRTHGQSVTITGQITNTKAAFFSMFSKYDVNRLDTIRLDKDGRFDTKIELAEPIEVVCSAFNADTGLVFQLFLQPGRYINVSLDVKNRLRSLKFSGNLADPCKYINYLNTSGMRSADGRSSDKAARSPNTPADFLRIQDSILNIRLQFLDSFVRENPGMPEDFIQWEKQRQVRSRLLARAQYPIRILQNRPGELTLPADWFSFLDKTEYKEASFIQNYFGTEIYKGYISYITMVRTGISFENSWGNLDFLKAKFNFVNELDIPAIWDVICFKDLTSQIEDKGPAGTEELIGIFNEHSKSDQNKGKLAEIIGPWNNIIKGKIAPSFELPDATGRIVSLKDFQGKYVLLDFWATWCIPCRKEQPTLDSIMEEFNGKNITFISISTDNDRAKWKAMVTDEKLKGIHLIDTCGYSKEWLIQFIPTYVLINPQGKIVSSRAAYPSQGMRELLNSHPDI